MPQQTDPTRAEQYAKLMLILFKPWRSTQDLINSVAHADCLWEDNFDAWKNSGICSIEHRMIMDNMQLLHECKSARDTHRNNRITRGHQAIRLDIEERSFKSCDDAQIEDEEFVMHTIQAADDVFSNRSYDTLLNINDIHAHTSFKLFNFQSDTFNVTGTIEDATQTPDRETTWKRIYDARKIEWRQRQRLQATTSVEMYHPYEILSLPIRQIQAMDTATTHLNHIDSTIYVLPGIAETMGVNINSFISKWTLNEEQAMAFQLIAQRAQTMTGPPLKMFISGVAGTGKSCVIDAVCDFFRSRGEDHRIKLLAFMGIAAINIEGLTIHSALGLSQLKNNHLNAKSIADLQAMWIGTDWVIIDEQSMVSCELFADVSSALSIAKGNTEPFGGMLALHHL